MPHFSFSNDELYESNFLENTLKNDEQRKNMPQLDEGVIPDGIDITFYDHHAPLIFTYLSRQVSSQQDAEDLLLEVFLAAFQHEPFRDFDSERQIAWLKRVARNKVIDRYRHQARLTMLPLETALETLDEALTPEQHVLQQEAYEQLYRALKQLPSMQQQIIYLRFSYRLRLNEIAEMLGKRENTVRSILSRTLRYLRTIYEQQ
jgi:RNA polymerase sigma-70 factor (ECF subfamily)